MSRPIGVLVVTGTGTGVGKTVVTAALAAAARARNETVTVVKLAQTGVRPGEPGDLAEVRRLAGPVGTLELARFPSPLSPEAAARAAGLPPLGLEQAVSAVGALADARDQVLVEGAGGLLVRYGPQGTTVADVARLLRAAAVVVTGAGLGTLNHTALTLEALAARQIPVAGVVIGSWPADPGLAERNNVADLEVLAAGPLSGAIPAGAGRLPRAEFCRLAPQVLAPWLGGRFDPAVFREKSVFVKELT